MYGPFGLELAKIRIEELCAEAAGRKDDGPARWRRASGRMLTGTRVRLGRLRALSVRPRVERRRV